METATIVLFTYKRIESLKKCLASLLACELAPASDLVVFSDAPRTEADTAKVAVVRSFLHGITGFKSVRIVDREQNMGVDYNIINGIKEIEKSCERFIILEDDVVFSRNFLLFMNQALARYEHHPEVLSVSGFAFVNNIRRSYPYDAYFTYRSWSWGWGSWGAKIRQVDWDVKDYPAFSANRSLQSHFNKTGGSDLTRMLVHTMEGKIRAWDIRLFYYQFKHQLLTLYPVCSKTINIGFTGEGSNTFGYNRYKPILDTGSQEHFSLPESTEVDTQINAGFLRKNNVANRIKTRLFSMVGIK